MLQTTTLLLTRHGQTEWNVERRMQGQSDSALTDLGLRQAKALGQRLESFNINAIYASDLKRAAQTAEIIKGKRLCSITMTPMLREIFLGPWQGRLIEEVKAEEPILMEKFWKHPELYFPQNAESYGDFRKRLSLFVEEIASKHIGETILIVTHGIALKALYTHFKGLPLSEIANMPSSPLSTSLTIVEKGNSAWDLKLWNDTDHYKFII